MVSRAMVVVIGALLAVLCLVVTAPGVEAGPRRGGPVVMSLQGPDLVIQEIIVREQTSGEFSQVRVDVRVRNKGGAVAAASEVMLLYTQNVMATPSPGMIQHAPTGVIAAGAYEDVEFVIAGIAGSFKGMLVAVADVPVPTAASGQVKEGKLLALSGPGGPIEGNNNGFAAIFNLTGRTLPVRLRNPAEN